MSWLPASATPSIRVRCIAACVLAALVAGCSLVPPYQRPAVPLASAFDGAAHVASLDATVPVRSGWWREYRDPALDALVEQSLAHNFSLASAMAAVEQARGTAEKAGAAQYPSLALGATFDRSHQGGRGGSTSKGQSLFAEASYEIDFWGLNAATANSADLLARASEFDRDTVALTLTASVVDTYFSVQSLRPSGRARREDRGRCLARSPVAARPTGSGRRHRVAGAAATQRPGDVPGGCADHSAAARDRPARARRAGGQRAGAIRRARSATGSHPHSAAARRSPGEPVADAPRPAREGSADAVGEFRGWRGARRVSPEHRADRRRRPLQQVAVALPVEPVRQPRDDARRAAFRWRRVARPAPREPGRGREERRRLSADRHQRGCRTSRIRSRPRASRRSPKPPTAPPPMLPPKPRRSRRRNTGSAPSIS